MIRFLKDVVMYVLGNKEGKDKREFKEYIRIEHIDYNSNTGKWEHTNRISHRMRRR